MLIPKRQITILGAGLVGSLLAVLLRKRGFEVSVYERRPDMRLSGEYAGRSINLAMSTRGWHALELAGLRQALEAIAIPMYGRYLHQADGSHTTQPYSKNNEAIYSVSRGELNKRLMTLAEEHGATIHFNHRCSRVNLQENLLYFTLNSGEERTVKADLLIGADGAFSALRTAYTQTDRISSSLQYLEYGYKELCIPPDVAGNMLMEKNYLHIWPRGSYMMIALPNTDGTFTCTLFMPFEGENSFEKLTTKEAVSAFFNQHFADAVPLMPGLLTDFFANPTSSLVTSYISQWHYQDKSMLIGDAAHAIVPFYGQGMNAGFEDCTVLAGLLDGGNHTTWQSLLHQYHAMRKPNGDAVAALALNNFIEMRDKVASPAFLERKKIEKDLGSRFPEHFISVYEMVSFTHLPYNKALKCIAAQDELLHTLMSEGNYFENINDTLYCGALQHKVMNYYAATQQF
ncbi:MAG: FAD-dependent monooxygenase [Chitinophagia bacterium]|nr:FAD-dependent monooxygenase [Chitinophagia bacterium]